MCGSSIAGCQTFVQVVVRPAAAPLRGRIITLKAAGFIEQQH
jgi:hypothetical protein